MKALIMAAGYGTRLEPLTLAVPKPMVPIVNIPTMQHNLELLKSYGLKDIVTNLHYHPEQIQNYFGDGDEFGVDLTYSFEEKLLGTAGGVRRMAVDIAGINETFVVLSSDALTDINLKQLIAFHRKKKSLMTIALAKVEEVGQFGVVIQDEDGRITGFQEKPEPEAALSHLANTGIYVIEPEILKMMPEGFYDFGRELFPRLASYKAAFYGYPIIGYWSDVGNLEKYIEASYGVGSREKIDRSAGFEGSVIIGDSCNIGKNVYIKDSVIGDKCTIEDGAIITGSVLWSDVVVEQEGQINQSVVGNWCHVGAKAKIAEGSVIANRTILQKGAEVPPRTRIQPNSIV